VQSLFAVLRRFHTAAPLLFLLTLLLLLEKSDRSVVPTA
jgi:hypothetical protein